MAAGVVGHTPGPWGWTYDGSSTYSVGLEADPQYPQIASIWDRNDKRGTANARLIAAAPDLLTALKAIVNGTEGIYDEDRDAAERAIAKAEGR